MAEEDGVIISGHASIAMDGGLTVAQLRVLLLAVDKMQLPDTAEVRVRTSWNVNTHGARVKKITVARPE